MKRLVLSIVILFITALLLEGFQCASKEMVTAKTEYAKKNYAEAVTNLEKELANNPTNEDALMMLIKIKLEQGKLQQAANILNDAEKKVTLEKNKVQIPRYKYNLWVSSFNKGRNYYLNYFNSGERSDLDSALFYINTGIIIRPEILEFYNLRAYTQRELGDTAASISSFETYIGKLDEELKFAENYQVFWKEDIQSVLNNLKIETTARIDTNQDGTLLRVEKGIVDSNELVMYSAAENAESKMELLGFRLNLPNDWTEEEKLNFAEFKLDAFRTVAIYYYEKEDLRKALEISKLYQKFDPFDKSINNFVVNIYQALGQENDAIDELKSLINKNPDNELYYLLLADLYANLEEYDKAVEKYEEALKLKTDYGIAFRNLGSTYKNKASKAQDAEKRKKDEDESYEIDPAIYKPDLVKSASAFEKALKTKDYEGSPDILIELSELYHLTKNDKKLMPVLSKLENIESRIENNMKDRYYGNLLRIYSERKNDAKSSQIERKYQEYLDGK